MSHPYRRQIKRAQRKVSLTRGRNGRMAECTSRVATTYLTVTATSFFAREMHHVTVTDDFRIGTAKENQPAV